MTGAGTEKGRHIWLAGPRGEWLEETDGDNHFELCRDAMRLRDMVEDDLALKGEIMGDVVRTVVSSMSAFWGDAWEAFETAQAHLVKMGYKRLSVFAWVEGKTAVIALGPLRGPEGLKGQAPMEAR